MAGAAQTRFVLEALEPRVLLSGVAAFDAVADAGVPSIRDGILCELDEAAEHPNSAGTDISYPASDEADESQGVFAGMEGLAIPTADDAEGADSTGMAVLDSVDSADDQSATAPELSPRPDEAPSGETEALDAESLAGILANRYPDRMPITTTDVSCVQAATLCGAASSMTEQLTETLRAANGPPSDVPVGQLVTQNAAFREGALPSEEGRELPLAWGEGLNYTSAATPETAVEGAHAMTILLVETLRAASGSPSQGVDSQSGPVHHSPSVEVGPTDNRDEVAPSSGNLQPLGSPSETTSEATSVGSVHLGPGSLPVSVATVLMGQTDVLSGSGSVVGDVIVQGQLSPGNSPGIQNISGDLTLTESSVTEIEIGGMTPGPRATDPTDPNYNNGYDQINVSGKLTLGGTLQVKLINGYTPKIGDVFEVLNGGTVSGSFKAVQGPVLGAGLSLVRIQSPRGLILVVSDLEGGPHLFRTNTGTATTSLTRLLAQPVANGQLPLNFDATSAQTHLRLQVQDGEIQVVTSLGEVLASQALSVTSEVKITAFPDKDTQVTVSESVLGLGAQLSVRVEAAGGKDSLLVETIPGAKLTWQITGPNCGTTGGQIEFHGIEDLLF